MAFLIIIMMPLAITEIGTDGWITGLMEEPMKAAGYNAGWVLVYTSAIMMVLRFFAGPIVHTLSPIGLLIVSSALAVAGLFACRSAATPGCAAIFAAATLVRARQDVLLADHAGHHVRAMSEGRCADAERDFGHRHDCGRRARASRSSGRFRSPRRAPTARKRTRQLRLKWSRNRRSSA